MQKLLKGHAKMFSVAPNKKKETCWLLDLLFKVRQVSNEILNTRNENISLDNSYTHMLVEWGQWIDHDMDLTPESASTVSFMDGADCSQACTNQNPCFPIQVTK